MDSLLDKHWHHLSPEEVMDLLGTDPDTGLDILEAKRRLAEFGANVLTGRPGKTALERLLLQFHQPLVYILIVAAVVTAVLGEWVDAWVICGVVLVNAVVGYVQEAKAVKALAALSATMKAEATLVRGGKTSRVDAAQLVPGDVIILRSGDKAPADVRIVWSRELRVDESSLTGESLPVEKSPAAVARSAVLAERTGMAYAGTLVAYGQGLGVVTATGGSTELGRIAGLVEAADELETPLTRKIAKFSHLLLVVILALAAVTFFIGILRGEPASHMFMAAVALAVGAIPEGLPAAMTIILAVGVSRMAARKAVIRRLPAVETLGGVTVVCSDKTGTLTENQMTVREIFAGEHYAEVTGAGYSLAGDIVPQNAGPDNRALSRCLLAGLLCNDATVESGGDRPAIQGDPTEAALVVAAAKGGFWADAARAGYLRLDTLPFESEHQYMATLHQVDEARAAFLKGSAEQILARCDTVLGPDGAPGPLDREAMLRVVDAMAAKGLRVLALAEKAMPGDGRQVGHGDVASGGVFLGFQGMLDPPRPEAVAAVAAFRKAGVRVKMITGDHAVTAVAVGNMLGLGVDVCRDDPACKALTGAQLAAIGDEELIGRVQETSVFARVSPEQKLRLVMALQARGEVAAMTGDGVNDAPALKQADIGVAMGRSGTDAAKEAADMVLTDDNFATIAAAVEEGRGVFDNLIKFIVWTLPTNLGEGLVILAAFVFGTALPILPVQILWINMTTAGSLGLMLAFEPREPGIMDRPPRAPDRPILGAYLAGRILLVGVALLVASFGLFEWELALGSSPESARTVAVNVFVMAEAVYLFNARSFFRSPFAIGFFSNPYVIGGVGLMAALQLLYTYAPVMNALFGSAPIGLGAWGKIAAASVVIFCIVELEKRLRRDISI
ncbi:cation-transporting P-type ATPase [Desulfovibrio sulfodismutans]|uniref:Cation-transporting P-type ATPase n=1 Tax=Desulfolutivibrio sulfodismutans TaxID=63561 RepID=A0A7K3NPE2_9BACT|nr:cation-transporting P-type ATPase [Desulfolutivibrio sulfodismutans]NDY57987.1 cation-transporting P-type ATPase [Desulfolutivibrio sulfodismutans]QLA12761.1 HAD-IC family P-type ATPase [Desulfolutivibrio sulfodismutans DSM 3696]